ncbi:MAG: hypothetical protein ACYTE3_28075 [Planctomycetota bacterium]|jgi:hypothetical protein
MAADEFTWVMSELVSRFREHIGLSSTSDITDANAHKWINDYYRHVFPLQLDLDLLNGWYTQELTAVDEGRYALNQTVLDINRPVTVNGSEIRLYMDKEEFFRAHPLDSEQYITAPGLAIGTSDSTKVKHDAFKYEISGNSYSVSSAETLKINTSGTVTIAEASGNSSGYATAGLAIDGLSNAGSDSCYMGYVTVYSTDSGGFIPGTTALDAAAVTDTYTDGKGEDRNDPQGCFIFDEYLYVRPKADRIMQLRAPYIVRPDAIDTGAPLDVAWGPLIALGAAILYLAEADKDSNLVAELARLFEARKNSLDRKQRKQKQERYAKPSL